MRWMFVFLIALLVVADFLGHNPGLGPGLSVKNVVLYAIVMTIVFRMALTGNFRLRMPGLHMAWGMWIGYAILTWFAASVIIHYRGYDVIQSAIGLKSDLIDSALYCFAVFYAVENEKDYKTVRYALMATIGLTSIMTVTDVIGLTSLGTKVGSAGAEADRVFGAFGHANETAAMLGLMLPAVISTALANRGHWRLFWIGCSIATAMVFILTVSRGGYFAVAVGYPLAAFMFRGLIPPGRIVGWSLVAVASAVVAAGVVSVVNPATAASIADRVLGIGTMGVSEASSGRTDIWSAAIGAMMDNPITLLTGFGWNVYSTMPTIFAMHNTYLDQWFNLGVLGVAVYVMIIWQTIASAKRAAADAVQPLRGDMIAYVFGMMALAIAIFFGNLYTPKPYLWLYVGLTMRGAVMVFDQVAAKAPPATARPMRLGVDVSLRRPSRTAS